LIIILYNLYKGNGYILLSCDYSLIFITVKLPTVIVIVKLLLFLDFFAQNSILFINKQLYYFIALKYNKKDNLLRIKLFSVFKNCILYKIWLLYHK